MKRLSLIVAAVIMLAACSGTQIRVMSYNIRLGVAEDGENAWQNRKVATPAMLDDICPTVFGVQEAYDFQVDYILEQCPRYNAAGVGRDDGINAGEHMSVFYDTNRIQLLDWGTWWLSETPDVPSYGWDAACRRTATWTLLKDKKSGKKFYFVNTHLDHVGKLARKNGLALIYDKIREMNPDGLPMVLTGDFNVMPDDECLTDISSLMNSARFVTAHADTIGSFNGFGKNGYSDAAPSMDEKTIHNTLWPLDYIYYSGFDKCLCFRVVAEKYEDRPFISDHYPVYADLVL